MQAAAIAGVTALRVHALFEQARRFVVSRGFIGSPGQPMTLCMMRGSMELARAVRGPCQPWCSSRSTSGWSTETRSSVLAAPVGARRPCSQSCSVRGETPSRAANSCCESAQWARA
jgi:hypothetical protein